MRYMALTVLLLALIAVLVWIGVAFDVGTSFPN